MQIILATHNHNKVKEINQVIQDMNFEFSTLYDIGWKEEIEEYGKTLEENAWIKAETVYQKLKKNVLSEDTGLNVKRLNGAPGIHTGRYAGENKDALKNNNLLLSNLKNTNDREAEWTSVMALIIDDKRYQFTGKCKGTISKTIRGSKGFGYDPVFIPHGYNTTFAELDQELKNNLSSRAKVLKKVLNFLNSNVLN